MSPFAPCNAGATVKESTLDPVRSSVRILKGFFPRSHSARRVWDIWFSPRATSLRSPGAKPIVFVGRDNGLHAGCPRWGAGQKRNSAMFHLTHSGPVNNGNNGDTCRSVVAHSPDHRSLITSSYGGGKPPRRFGQQFATAPIRSGTRSEIGWEIGPRCRRSEIARQCGAAMGQERPSGQPGGLFLLPERFERPD